MKIACYGLYACAMFVFHKYSIDTEGYVILTVLLLIDTIFGIAKSYVLYGENSERFSSRKLKIGALSKFGILTVVVVIGLVVSQISSQEVGNVITGSLIAMLVVAEAISILQNVLQIKTKRKIDERDAISYILSSLNNKLRTSIEETMDHTHLGIKNQKKDN